MENYPNFRIKKQWYLLVSIAQQVLLCLGCLAKQKNPREFLDMYYKGRFITPHVNGSSWPMVLEFPWYLHEYEIIKKGLKYDHRHKSKGDLLYYPVSQCKTKISYCSEQSRSQLRSHLFQGGSRVCQSSLKKHLGYICVVSWKSRGFI